jgi:hypothetical protein
LDGVFTCAVSGFNLEWKVDGVEYSFPGSSLPGSVQNNVQFATEFNCNIVCGGGNVVNRKGLQVTKGLEASPPLKNWR